MKKQTSIFLILSIVLYILMAVFLYQGYDKTTNYSNPEYSTTLAENVYVGGDAYNYIINSNYATGRFVLAMGFGIMATLFLIADKNNFVNNGIKEEVVSNEGIEKEQLNDVNVE